MLRKPATSLRTLANESCVSGCCVGQCGWAPAQGARGSFRHVDLQDGLENTPLRVRDDRLASWHGTAQLHKADVTRQDLVGHIMGSRLNALEPSEAQTNRVGALLDLLQVSPHRAAISARSTILPDD